MAEIPGNGECRITDFEDKIEMVSGTRIVSATIGEWRSLYEKLSSVFTVDAPQYSLPRAGHVIDETVTFSESFVFDTDGSVAGSEKSQSSRK